MKYLEIKMPKYNNHPFLKRFRKDLRNHSTSAEATFWTMLQNRKVGGLKFRRQHSVGRYILDFYCPELKLAVELEGEYHSGHWAEARDRERDSFLKELGIEVLRFENRWVFEFPKDIIDEILKVKEMRQRI